MELDERLATQVRVHFSAAGLLTAATSGGHASLWWGAAGTLVPGALADLVSVDLASVRLAGAQPATLLEHVVFAANAADGIGVLVTNDPGLGPGPLGLVHDAALVLDGGAVVWAGPRAQVPDGAASERVDVGGRAVVPGFVDSHGHLVFAGDRTPELAARMSGQAYTAGGIATTVAATRGATDLELSARAGALVAEALRQGTTTIECKSGYGLTVADERRSLEIAGAHTDEVTYLGAHVVPAEHAGDPDAYVDLVRGEMLDACAPLARSVDVFCERGAFDGDQTRAILEAGIARGLVPRVHANQLSHGPGVQIAVELGAASADHVTYASDADVAALAGSATVATLLPGAELSTRAPYPDARRLLDAGVTVALALAADCNPGSSFTTSMGSASRSPYGRWA